MADESRKAQRYEALRPGTGISEAQKEERMERMDFKQEVRALRRTSRNRGVIFDVSNPWLDSLERERTA